MKRIIKLIVFLLIFCLLFSITYRILWLDSNSVYYFFKEPKNSFDIVYIGASNAFYHFNTTLSYELYGYTTGLLSAIGQPFVLVKYLLQESAKYQKPSLYVIDMAKAADDFYDMNYGEVRQTIDYMKFSSNRIKAINDILSYKKDANQQEYNNWYFSFLLYHNKWKDISKYNIIGNTTLYKGYVFSDFYSQVESFDTYYWSNEVMPLQEENKQVLEELIDYIKTNHLNVLFVVPRRCYEEDANARLNDAIRILQENKLDVVNFNTLEDFNVNYSTELVNAAHLNVYGATKYTLYFSKYLKENYELQDHRGDENYISWMEEYERFKKDYNKVTGKSFDELLLEYNR